MGAAPMVEAFTIERHIPDKRVGPAIVEGAWATSRPPTRSPSAWTRASLPGTRVGKVGARRRGVAL